MGTNGSGKSTRIIEELIWRLYTVRAIPANAYKVVLIDSKPVSYGENDAVGHYAYLPGHIVRDWREIDLVTEPERLIIYRPYRELVTPQEFTQLFDKLSTYNFRTPEGNVSALPVTVVVDELSDILSDSKKRVTYIEGFSKMLAEGRSALQTLWIGTQFPVYIDPGIKRNVRVNFCFRLPDEDDRKTMAGVLGWKAVKEPIRDVHGFWYQNDAIQATLDHPIYFDGRKDRAQLRVVR